MAWQKLTQKRWAAIALHLPAPPSRPKGGRPPLDNRRCFEGILWILWTGAQWKALPQEFGSPSAVHRRSVPVGAGRHAAQPVARFPVSTQRTSADSLERVLCRQHVRARQKGGAQVGKTKRGKGSKLMVLADGAGAPLGVLLASASPAEVTLLHQTIQQVPWA